MPRVFPHDLEAERSLLGSMLISKEACQDILNKCEDGDFYEESHKVLFNAMSELSRQNIPVDVTTITSYLLDHSQLDKVGGVEYLRQLSDSVPTLAHSEYYLKIIHNKSILRKIINETTKIAEMLLEILKILMVLLMKVKKQCWLLREIVMLESLLT